MVMRNKETRVLVSASHQAAAKQAINNKRNVNHSLAVMDFISLLDLDVCGKFIWSNVPSTHVAMILSMNENTTGGIFSKLDFRKWMLDSLEQATQHDDICSSIPRDNHFLSFKSEVMCSCCTSNAHIVDLNELSKAICKNTIFTMDKKERDEEYLIQCVKECVDANLSFFLCLSQCSFCSNIQGVTAKHSQHCTRALPTCTHVAEFFARVASKVSNMVFFKVKISGIHVDNEYGRAILKKAEEIFERAEYVRSLEVSDVFCTVSEDSYIINALKKAKEVEKLCFRNICIFHGDQHRTIHNHNSHGNQVVHYLGMYCMPLSWIEAVYKASNICNLRSLIISRNVLLPDELYNCAQLLWRCPFLEELVFADHRRGTKTGNLGVWVMTAMSNLAMQEIAERGENKVWKYRQLKSITFDVSCPHLQVLNAQGEALIFENEITNAWSDMYPPELLDFQLANEIGIGGSVSCLISNMMPALETIRIRCGDNFSLTTGLQLIRNICRHRSNEPKKLKNLIVYSAFAHKSIFTKDTPLGSAVKNTFENVTVMSTSCFPFF